MEFGQSSGHAQDLMVEAIAASPGSYTGLTVRLEGWITFEPENVAIYSSAEALHRSYSSATVRVALRHSLWLELEELIHSGYGALVKALQRCNKSFAGPGVVEGVVDPDCTGHLDLWPAGLNPLRRLVLGTAATEWPVFDWWSREARRVEEACAAEEHARYLLKTTARAVLAREIHIVDAARDLADLYEAVVAEPDPADVLLLLEIRQAMIHLPSGATRKYCAAELLERVDAEREKYEAVYGERLRALCRRVLLL